MANTKTDPEPQIDRFKELARELGCDEDEIAFDDALRRNTRSKNYPSSPGKPAEDDAS